MFVMNGDFDNIRRRIGDFREGASGVPLSAGGTGIRDFDGSIIA